MRRWFAAISTRLWRLGAWLAARRRGGVGEEAVQRQVFRDATGRMGVRMNDRVRDGFRGRWLRLRRDSDSGR